MTRPRVSLRANLRRSPLFAEVVTGRGYRAVGRTLTTPGVANADRAARLERATYAHLQAEADLDEAVAALLAATEIHEGFTRRSVDAHERACGRRLIHAEAELADAKRSASRPVGELVTPRHAEVYRPVRTWPNALPGGTSPRRAIRAATGEHLVAFLEGRLPVHVASPASVREQVLSTGQAVVAWS